MRGGVLQQVAAPQELYHRPANLFVAAFIGSPAMNLLHATIAKVGDEYTVEFGGHRLGLGARTLDTYPRLAERAGGPVIVGLRPEHFEMAADSDLASGAGPDRRMKVTTLLAEAMGAEVHVHFRVDAESAGLDPRDIGVEAADATPDTIAVAQGGAEMVARVDGMNVINVGDQIELVVRTDRIHFFDRDDGTPLR